MNRARAIRLAAVAVLSLVTGHALADDGPAPVRVNTDGLTPRVAAAVQEKAGQGVVELRRYVERTRMIHALYLPGLVREDGGETVSAQLSPEAPVLAKAPPARPVLVAAKKAPVVVARRQAGGMQLAKAAAPKAAPQPVRKLAGAAAPTRRA